MRTVFAGVASLAFQPVPLAPSRVVECGRCGQSCWLSIATGDATIAEARRLAALYGCPMVIACQQCIALEEAVTGTRADIRSTPQALAEYLRATS